MTAPNAICVAAIYAPLSGRIVPKCVPVRKLGTFEKPVMRKDHSVGKMIFMDSVRHSFFVFSAGFISGFRTELGVVKKVLLNALSFI
jgi:hypothetical protein